MKGDCQQWWDSRVQPKRERKEGIAGVDTGRKALLRYDGTYFRKGIEEAKNIQESRNTEIQESRNPRIQKSKNPEIQAYRNPKIQTSNNSDIQQSRNPSIINLLISKWIQAGILTDILTAAF